MACWLFAGHESRLRRFAFAGAVVLLCRRERTSGMRNIVRLTPGRPCSRGWPPHARAHRNLAAELKLANPARNEETRTPAGAAVKDLPESVIFLASSCLAARRNAYELSTSSRTYPAGCGPWANLGNALSGAHTQR